MVFLIAITTAPKCMFLSGDTLAIFLGYGATLLPGDFIKLKAGAVVSPGGE